MSAAARLPSLRALSVSNCGALPQECLLMLQPLGQLTRLELGCRPRTGATEAYLDLGTPSLPRLQELRLVCPRREVCGRLSRLPALRSLEVQAEQARHLLYQAARDLPALRRLVWVGLGANPDEDWVKGLASRLEQCTLLLTTSYLEAEEEGDWEEEDEVTEGEEEDDG